MDDDLFDIQVTGFILRWFGLVLFLPIVLRVILRHYSSAREIILLYVGELADNKPQENKTKENENLVQTYCIWWGDACHSVSKVEDARVQTQQNHYNGVIMSAMASQITNITIV